MGEDGPFAPEWYHSEFGDSSILGQATGPYPFPKDETWELANFLPVETPDYLSRFSTDCGIEYLRDYPRLEPNYGSVSKLEAGAISNNFSDLGVPFLDVDGRHQRASASPGHSGSWELDPTAGAGSWALHSVEASQHRANTATSRLNLDRKPVCKQCHRMFSTGYELEEHARMFNHRSYVCTEPGCDKSYCRRDVLLRHGATHKSSDFHCSFCLKANRKRSFKRKDHLAQHIRNRHLHTSSAGSSSDSEAVHHKGATNTEDSCCSGSEDSIECRNGRSKTIRDVASAMGKIMGENHVTVQMIERGLGSCGLPQQEEIALSLAELALLEPNRIPAHAKAQLQRRPASRSLRLDALAGP